jgi:DNA-binding CsgD family transcriptional regulator
VVSALLELADFRAAYGVLEDCGGASTLEGFRLGVVDSVGRRLGLRNLVCAFGVTPEDAAHDHGVAVSGRAAGMAGPYFGGAWEFDPFARGEGLALLRERAVVSLGDLRRARVWTDRYVSEFLHPNRIVDQVQVVLPAGGFGAAYVAVLADRDRPITSSDVLRLELIAKPLGNLLRFHMRAQMPALSRVGLSAREREVAELASAGLTNRDIAATLFIAESTVKKHLTRILAVTGCHSRTQLAAAWRSPTPPTTNA